MRFFLFLFVFSLFIFSFFFSCEEEFQDFEKEIKKELDNSTNTTTTNQIQTTDLTNKISSPIKKPVKPTKPIRQILAVDESITWMNEENDEDQTPWQRRTELSINAYLAKRKGDMAKYKLLKTKHTNLQKVIKDNNFSPFNNSGTLTVKRSTKIGEKNSYGDSKKTLLLKKEIYHKVECILEQIKNNQIKTFTYHEGETVKVETREYGFKFLNLLDLSKKY